MQQVKSPTFESYEYVHMYLSVMVQAMCLGGRKAVEVVNNNADLCSLFSFVECVVLDHLRSIKRSVSTFEEFSHVGKMAAKGDKKIAELVAKAFEKVGKDGCFVFSEYEHESDKELEFLNQMRLDWEPISPVFITNQKKKIVLKHPLFLICEDTVSYKNVAEQAIKWGRPLLIVAEDVEDKVAGSLILDKSLQKKVKRESLAQARHILNVIKDAVRWGIVPGAGVAFLQASKLLEESVEESLTEDFYGNIAIQLFQNALKMPVYTITASAGFDGSFVIKKLLEQENPNLGFDPTKGEFVDVIKSGAWDQYLDIQSMMYKVIREFKEVCWSYYYLELNKYPWFCKLHFINALSSFMGGVGSCKE